MMFLMMHQPHLHQPWRLDRCNPFIHSFLTTCSSGTSRSWWNPSAASWAVSWYRPLFPGTPLISARCCPTWPAPAAHQHAIMMTWCCKPASRLHACTVPPPYKALRLQVCNHLDRAVLVMEVGRRQQAQLLPGLARALSFQQRLYKQQSLSHDATKLPVPRWMPRPR